MKAIALQPLIESVLEAVWLVDAIELKIVAVNRAAEQLLGVSRDEMVGRAVVDYAHTAQDLFFWEDVAAGASDRICSETLLSASDGRLVQVDRRVTRMHSGEHGGMLYVVAMIDRSAQHRVEQELENIIAELRATLESTADGILVTDMDGGIRGYNRRFAELWELPDALLTDRDDIAIFGWLSEHVADSERYAERIGRIARSPLLEAEDVLVLRSGKVLERVTLPQYARGRPIGRVYSFRDITQRLADETRLKLAAHVFESSLDAIFVVDTAFLIQAANPTFFRLTGFGSTQVEGRPIDDFMSNPSESGQSDRIRRAAVEQGFWQGELWARRASGETYPCLLSMVRVLDEEGRPSHYIGFFKDLTEVLAAKQRIEELAFSDALTRLPNRVLLKERFEFAISHAQRHKTPFAVLFLDLDRFKQINDSLGHAFGDRVLVEVAERLTQCLRQIDTAARLGGDEFVLLLNQVDGGGAEAVARRALQSVLQPITLDGMSFSLTCSIGIAMYPEDGGDMEELIKNADSAMYAVKERGRSDFRFYQRQMNIGLLSRVKLDHALRQALEQNRFRLHYQAKVSLETGELLGVEALARWCDPELGDVPPAKFIPVAEESGAIVPLGNWVMEEAIRQAAEWQAAGLELPVAVNVSAMQFHQQTFVAGVADALARHQLPGRLLELELTESILITDIDEVMRRLNALFALGVQLSIDDFGTGFSSLSYLKRFPISRLKIDRSFVADVPGNCEDEAIVVAIVQLGKALRLAVTAEGVETEAQRAFLSEQGCGEAQGYLFSRPLPVERFEERYLRPLLAFEQVEQG
jgi:diguanylate cyclase (GGDEF)-like protein/PAS domain S-box-containing protein